jgi:GPH family glycoside/pentoside/hexuronide:cation symporter
MHPPAPDRAAGDPEQRAPRHVLVAYAAPALSSSFLFTAVSPYLLKYSTDVLLMAPATMGLLFGFSRFWDALTDPLVGHLSDRTHSRWGRRRPWLVASALPVALAYYAIWAPPESLVGDGLTLWMGAAIVAFYAAVTAFSVPYTALGAELSAGYHDRSRIFGAKAVGDQIGILAAAGSLLVMERATEPRVAAGCVATLAGVLMLGGILWAVAVLREPADHQGRGGSRPYASFADVFRNRDARILIGVFFLEMLGYNAFVTLLPYVTEYILETPGSTAYYLFAAILTTLVSVPAWIWLSRRFGKIRVWSAALAVKLGVFAGMALVGAGDWLLIGALTLVFGAATGASAVLGPSLKADVVDSDEAVTGERKEGTFFAAWGLAIKAAIGCAIVLSGFVLSATGFQPNAVQTPEALLGIRALVSVFPLACHALAIALVVRLGLDEDAHAAIRIRIRARRAAAPPDFGPGRAVSGRWPATRPLRAWEDPS